jgi:hypothetical protein
MMEIRALQSRDKTPGVGSRHFLNQVSEAPLDCQAIFRHPLANIRRPIDALYPIAEV